MNNNDGEENINAKNYNTRQKYEIYLNKMTDI